MAHKDYNNMILKRIESSFDKLMPFCALLAWIAAIAIYFSPIHIRFLYIDVGIGLMFALITIFSKKLEIEIKIILTIFAPALIGILAFLDGGFSSSGITLLMVSNVVAVLFLSKKKSMLIAIFSIVIFIALWIILELSGGPTDGEMNPSKWIIHLFTLMFYLIVLQTTMFSIKKYLLDSIAKLENTVEITRQLAYYDQLTGLPNYITMKTLIKERVIEDSLSGSIVYFRIKNLSLINSIYNRKIGDLVLINSSKVFENIKKPYELLARTESNGFVFWIDKLENESIEERINYIESKFQDQFKIQNMNKQVEFNISYVKLSKEGSTIEGCFDKVSIALTYAKIHNLNGIIAYDKAFDEIIREEEHIKELIKYALEYKTFTISYQEKIEVSSGKVIGVEALARWAPESLGIIGPGIFIPVIENMQMSIAFGEIIIKKVFGEYKELQKKYHNDIIVSINISPSHLASEGFVDFLENQLKISNIPPCKVMLEITEEVMIKGIDLIKNVVKSLKIIGVKLSLDDFGTGYSSLNYLVQIDIDELKIDRTFITQLDTNDKINIVLEMLVNLAKEYNLDIVAEGVETKRQVDRLTELGYYVIQGYYFSRPLPL